jgi:DNA-binding NarL/FixJ family response regulator
MTENVTPDGETSPGQTLPTTSPSISIVIADDHRAIREGFRSAFEDAGIQVLDDVGDGFLLIDSVLRHHPTVIVTDISMPRCGGIEATKRIRQHQPAAKIIALTMHDDVDTVRNALAAGACAFLSKDCAFADVLATVRKVAEGTTVLSQNVANEVLRIIRDQHARKDEVLSPRQVEVLQAVSEGLNTNQIARKFDLSSKTINNHLAAIYRRLDTQNLTQAILRAVRLGIIDIHTIEP